MKSVHAVHATPENFGRFGVVQRLTDQPCFSGDGWKCWMTEDVCMDQPAHFGVTYVKTCPPYEVASMERHTKPRN
jgi:ureidoglycolate lyase